MTVQSVDYLKALFERGDKPSNQDFIDLIDSFVHQLGGNMPNPLPAVSAENLTNIPLPDPLPALSGENLINVQPSQWHKNGDTPGIKTSVSFVVEGDVRNSYPNDLNLRLLRSPVGEYITRVVSTSYGIGLSLNVAAGGTLESDLYLSQAGNVLLTLHFTTRTISKWDLSVSSDVASGSYSGKQANVSGVETAPNAFTLSHDETKLFLLGGNKRIYQYTIGSDLDPSLMVYTGKSFDVSGLVTSAARLKVKSDGSTLWILDGSLRVLIELSFGTIGDIETLSSTGKTLSLAGEGDTEVYGFDFSSDYSKLYYSGRSTNKIYQYGLQIAGDIESGIYSNKNLNVSAQDTLMQSVVIGDSDQTIYMIGASSNAVHQYSLGTPGDVDTGTYGKDEGFTSINVDDSIPSDVIAEMYVAVVKPRESVDHRTVGIADTERLYDGGTTGGTEPAYTCSVDASVDALFEGLRVVLKAHDTNTGNVTLDVNGLGAVAVKTVDGNNLATGQFTTNGRYELVYSGTEFLLISRPSGEHHTESERLFDGGTTGGTEPDYTCSITSSALAVGYFPGLRVIVKPHASNTGNVTLNVNSLGVKGVRTLDGGEIYPGLFDSGGVYTLVYNGTNFNIVSQLAAPAGHPITYYRPLRQLYLLENGATDGSIIISNTTTQTFGPSGSGATNIVPDLDVIPTDAVAMRVLVKHTLALSGSVNSHVYGNGLVSAFVSGSPPVGTQYDISYVGAGGWYDSAAGGSVIVEKSSFVDVFMDSSRVFSAHKSANSFASSGTPGYVHSATMYLAGFWL